MKRYLVNPILFGVLVSCSSESTRVPASVPETRSHGDAPIEFVGPPAPASTNGFADGCDEKKLERYTLVPGIQPQISIQDAGVRMNRYGSLLGSFGADRQYLRPYFQGNITPSGEIYQAAKDHPAFMQSLSYINGYYGGWQGPFGSKDFKNSAQTSVLMASMIGMATDLPCAELLNTRLGAVIGNQNTIPNPLLQRLSQSIALGKVHEDFQKISKDRGKVQTDIVKVETKIAKKEQVWARENERNQKKYQETETSLRRGIQSFIRELPDTKSCREAKRDLLGSLDTPEGNDYSTSAEQLIEACEESLVLAVTQQKEKIDSMQNSLKKLQDENKGSSPRAQSLEKSIVQWQETQKKTQDRLDVLRVAREEIKNGVDSQISLTSKFRALRRNEDNRESLEKKIEDNREFKVPEQDELARRNDELKSKNLEWLSYGFFGRQF